MSRDPLGKRALFSPAPTTEPEPPAAESAPDVSGRRAMFSSTSPPPPPPPAPRPRAGTVIVECRRCGGRAAVSFFGLLARLFPSMWVPLGRFNRWMRCPSCEHLTWCRVEWPFPSR